MPHPAKAFQNRDALAGLWISEKNRVGIHPQRFHRCWLFHAAMKPFYHGVPEVWAERAFYSFFPIWRGWLKSQRWPRADVVQAIMGYASEPFDVAEKMGALKVVDCQNSHPTSYYGFWQRECDIWSPGTSIPIPRWMFARMNRELERADVVLCPSNFVRDTMVANGVDAEKCFVTPFGVDTSVFRPRKSPPAVPRFISVGTICLRKGHQYLFQAFHRLKEKLPHAELICVGEVKRDFECEWKRWQGSFIHYPRLTHRELAELLQTCSAFVLASVEEGFARVLSEAAGAGLPIVATYESGATTIFTDGAEGFIVPARNPGRLAEAMLRSVADLETNEKLGQAAHKKGALQNSWQDYGDRLLLEYERRLNLRR